jgi:hypothetical protein
MEVIKYLIGAFHIKTEKVKGGEVMKVYIKQKGKTRGRYYSGSSENAILKKFIQKLKQRNPNLTFLRYEYYRSRVDLVMFDLKTGKKVTFEIPEDKIIR